jgi:hypothetical protein
MQPTDGTDLVVTVYADQVAEVESDKLQPMVNELLQKILEHPSREAAAPTSVKHAIVKPVNPKEK